jgi:integrase
MALKLSMMKDLGTRPIELTLLTFQDIDLTTGTTSITGAKASLSGTNTEQGILKSQLKLYVSTFLPIFKYNFIEQTV